MLTAAEHAQMSNEIVQISEETTEKYWDNPQALGSGTDWQDLIYQNAISQNYSLNIGGGNETTTYYVSGNWSDGESIVKNTDSERYSVRASVESGPVDYLRVGGNVTASRVSNRLAQLEGGARNATTVATAALQMWPQFPARFENGECPLMDVHNVSSIDNEIDGAFNGGGRNTENPICGLEGTNDRYTQDRGLATLFAELAPFEGTALEGLHVEARGSADIAQVRRQAFFDRSTRTGGLGTGGFADAGNVERTSLNFDVIPRYSATFLPDWQSLDVTSGFSWNREIIEGRGMNNSDFPTDVTGFNDIGAGAQSGGPGAFSYKSQSTMISGFGRVNYQLFGRYLLTGTFRGDGSSRFGVNNRWGLFPSAAIGWRLSEESFVPELFSNLKLRVSWGRSGNQEIGVYDQFSSFGNAQYNFDGTLVGGLAPSGLGNPNLTWEETTEWNVGLDASFLGGRISTTIEGFHQNTQELLLAVDLPPATGFNSATQNVGSLENMGIEASLNTSFLFGDLQWRQRINVAHVQNEVTDLGPNSIIFGGTINGDGGFGGGENGNAVIPGQPLGVFWGYDTDGLLRSEEEVQNHTGTNADGETVLLQPNAVPGDRRWIDHNGDGEITQADKHVIGDPNPDLSFGWSNTFRYQSVSLDVFLQGQLGGDIYNVTRQEISGASTGHNTFRERYEDAWTPDNRDAKWPRIATPPGQGTIVSTPKGPLLDVYLEDGSYLRAESITLTWNVADQFTIPTVRNASLFVGVQNAFTITGYSGVDPDINTEGQDNIRQGVDLGALPLSRNYQFGIRLGL
jgi:TonB-linked SusC/RagA family outer membrane protein